MTAIDRIQRALESAGWLNCDPEDWEAVRRVADIAELVEDRARLDWMVASGACASAALVGEGFICSPGEGAKPFRGNTARQAIDRARGVK